MAISKKALSQIELLLERHKALLKYLSVGPQSLSKEQLKDLLTSGVLKGFKHHGGKAIEAYLITHQQVSIGEPAPKSVQKGALEFLDRMLNRYIDKAADQFKTDVVSTIEGTLMPIQDRREGQAVYEALQDPQFYKKTLSSLLRDKVDSWDARYKTIINTELNRASNWGAMDAILNNEKDKGPEEITVFKIGNSPGGGACEHCIKFWFLPDRVTPRVYKMSELIAGGSNIGRKKNEWQPTVDSTHPNESHILHQLLPGWGFVGNDMQYIGKGHDEYAKQRGKK